MDGCCHRKLPRKPSRRLTGPGGMPVPGSTRNSRPATDRVVTGIRVTMGRDAARPSGPASATSRISSSVSGGSPARTRRRRKSTRVVAGAAFQGTRLSRGWQASLPSNGRCADRQPASRAGEAFSNNNAPVASWLWKYGRRRSAKAGSRPRRRRASACDCRRCPSPPPRTQHRLHALPNRRLKGLLFVAIRRPDQQRKSTRTAGGRWSARD